MPQETTNAEELSAEGGTSIFSTQAMVGLFPAASAVSSALCRFPDVPPSLCERLYIGGAELVEWIVLLEEKGK